MLLAQLHRKVPSEFEGMEDVLTSSVFALLKYLPSRLACKLLAEFADIPLQPGALELELWPRYSTPPGFPKPVGDAERDEETAIRGDTEPDVVIRAGEWLVLIEAKYRSALDDSYDQLGREFAVGYQLAKGEDRRFGMVVVTAHTLPPTPVDVDLATGVRRVLAAASVGLGDAAEEMVAAVSASLQWTSWQRVYRTLREARRNWEVSESEHRLLEDVCQLLELRGLKPYDDRPIARVMNQWEDVGIPDEAWSLPAAHRYRTTLSLAAGWEKLQGLDTTALCPVAWRVHLPLSSYDLAILSGFNLSELETLNWRPYQ